MKNLLNLFTLLLLIAAFVISCQDEEFTQDDAIKGQKELLRLADSINKSEAMLLDSLNRADVLLRDSLKRVGGTVNYTVHIIDAGNAGFLKSTTSNGVDGASVTASQYGLIQTLTTDETGMVVFDDLRIGKVSVNVSMTGFTPASFVAELNPATIITGDPFYADRSAASQVPLFPLTGSATTTLSGIITYESDLTNDSPEVAAGVQISASIDVDRAGFQDTYITTSGNWGSGQIIKIAYGDAVVSGTSDSSGMYSIIVPSTANGLPIRFDIGDVAVDQQLLMNTLNDKEVLGVQTVRTIFSSDPGITPSSIPAVRPVYVTFSDPDGDVIGPAPATAAVATAVISNGEVESIYISNAGANYTETPVVEITGNGTGATATAVLTDRRVTAVNVTNGGQGYTSATVTFKTGSGATATASFTRSVVDFTITAPGSSYTSAPTVTIDGDGSGATAVAEMLGYLDHITVINPGSGYTDVPEIIISGGNPTTKATATATLTSGPISSIYVPTTADKWFTSAPAITITAGGGAGAVATASLGTSGRVEAINIINAGTGYTSAPLVTISGGGGSGAVAVAQLGAGGTIGSITLLEKGSGYTTNPTVTLTGGGGTGGQADATRSFKIASVTITDGGNGYNNPATLVVNFDAAPITGTEVKLNRAVNGITITDDGEGYESVPTITFKAKVGGATAATATAQLKYYVDDISVTNGGSGYTTTPTVTIQGSATATATLGDGVLSKVTLGNPGSKYLATPLVTLTGGGATEQAVVTATVASGEVTGFTIVSVGKGYTSAPTVTIATNTTTAVASANLSSGSVVAMNITNTGAGYTVVPIVEFVSTSGSGAAATAVLDSEGRIEKIDVTSGGTGYLAAPTVNLVVPNTTVTAKGTVTVSSAGVVTGVTITNGGEGYKTAPTVTFTPAISGMGSDATGIANISGGKVTSVTITDGGSGYKSQNTPGNYYPDNTASMAGKSFTTTAGQSLDVKSATPVINDIYLGTGKRSIEN